MNVMLVIAGFLSALAAAIHLGCIFFGASWYRFFGAGEHMAIMAEQGSMKPTIITSVITFILVLWSFYAFSAAGVITQLPFVRTIVVVIAGIYLLRGVAGFYFMNNPLGRTPEFWIWSSSICLVIALVHILGLKQVWSTFS